MLSSNAASVPGKPWNFPDPRAFVVGMSDRKEVGHNSLHAFLITRWEDSQGLKRALSRQNLLHSNFVFYLNTEFHWSLINQTNIWLCRENGRLIIC